MTADIPKPQVLFIGAERSIIEATIPTKNGDIRRNVVLVDDCTVLTEGKRRKQQMVCIANEPNRFPIGETILDPIRDILPSWIVVYSGGGMNMSDPHYFPPYNHGGLWLRRDDIQIDNE